MPSRTARASRAPARAPADAYAAARPESRSTAGWPRIESAVDRDDQGDDQDRDDVRDLDHRVDRRARGVLVRIPDRIAGDGRRVRLRALAPVGAVLDQLLRVVPRAAA